MRSRIAATICAAAIVSVALPAALAAPPPGLPALTRIASKLSGLPAKRKVQAQVVSGKALEAHALRVLDRRYPRELQAYDETVYRALGILSEGERLRPALVRRHVKGVRGVYDEVRRVAYVRSGAGHREELLRQLVHALEDQRFNLRRLAGIRSDSRDAGLAAAAAAEGAAQISLLADARGLEAYVAPTPPLFLDLLAGFPSTTGARFAGVLRNVGGHKAVHSALARFPETTEQVFHVDKFLMREQAAAVVLPESAAGFRLHRRDTFGELDVRALLAAFDVPRLDQAGEGWGGGRTAIYRSDGDEAVAVVLVWDEELDAAQWAEAVETYVNEAFEPDVPGRPATTPCASATCWAVAGRSIAFARAGRATALVFGPDVAAAAALAVALATSRV